MPRHSNVLAALNETAWAILPEKLEEISGFARGMAVGEIMDSQKAHADRINETNAAMEGMDPVQRLYHQSGVQMQGPVAVVPMHGTMSQRMNMMTSISGGTSTQLLGATLRALDADPTVRGIVLDVDSPGGSVNGMSELVKTIKGLETKTISVANDKMASAAYWAASATDKIYASPEAIVGSIGVIMSRMDYSEKMAQEGVKEHITRSGPYKALGASSEPLTENEKADNQRLVDSYYKTFADSVQTNRNFSDEHMATIADGRVFIGDEAVTQNLVDDIKTVDAAIAELTADAAAEDRENTAWDTARTWQAAAASKDAEIAALIAERDGLAAAAEQTQAEAAAAAADTFIDALVGDGKIAASASDATNPGRLALRAKLIEDFAGTKALYDLVPSGAAAPGTMGAVSTPAPSADHASKLAEARAAGTLIADDAMAAEVFEEAKLPYFKNYDV